MEIEDDPVPGVPEWVVTYGDMMSLLLTFFIMLVSLSEVVADKKYRAILDSLQRYTGYKTGPLTPPGKNFPLNSMLAALDTLGSFSDKNKGRGGVKSEAVEGEELKVYRTREGTASRIGQPLLFDPNDATLSAAGKKELARIAAELAGHPNKIDIRAHASSALLPPDSPYPDKTSLTYARARSVADFLARKLDKPDRIRITAAADSEPLPVTSADQQPHQDRVEVLVVDLFADQLRGPRDTGE